MCKNGESFCEIRKKGPKLESLERLRRQLVSPDPKDDGTKEKTNPRRRGGQSNQGGIFKGGAGISSLPMILKNKEKRVLIKTGESRNYIPESMAEVEVSAD